MDVPASSSMFVLASLPAFLLAEGDCQNSFALAR